MKLCAKNPHRQLISASKNKAVTVICNRCFFAITACIYGNKSLNHHMQITQISVALFIEYPKLIMYHNNGIINMYRCEFSH